MAGFRLEMTSARLLALDSLEHIETFFCVALTFNEVHFQVE
jgi:hypothetical protein